MNKLITIIASVTLPITLFAQPKAIVPDPDPELERKSFIVAEGFEVNLFAADPLLAKPIQMNFDPQGRLWVATSEIYPHIKPGEKANDKIIILEDTKGVGKADKVTIFADGLLIPTGIEPGDGGAYVANSTELLHLSASKPGGKADKTRVLLSGFGTEDTHHILHTFRWGPDGMLYMNQSTYIHSHIETPYGVRRLNGGGIWQYRPETHRLEVFLRGFINTWGHHFDHYGQSFVTDGANGEGITHGVPGAGYSWAIGFKNNEILHGLNPGSPKHCGLEILSGSHLPEDWRGNMITNDFRGHRVCRFVIKDNGSTYTSQEKTELIKTNHAAFRPIDIKMGPDGAIYIADWYNPIIQHGEIDFRDPRRDHTHGRIWRVTAKGRPLVKKPDLVNAKTAELLDHLKSTEDWTRHNAKRVLKERGAKDVFPAVKEWITRQEDEHALLEALWVYQSLDVVNADLLNHLLRAKDYQVRAAAARVLTHWHERLPNALELLAARANDEHPRVRMEAVRSLVALKTARAAEVAMTALDRPTDKVLDYALWLTAKELEPVWLSALREGKLNFGGNARHLSFALQSVGSTGGIQPILKLLESKKLTGEREHSLWVLLARLGGPEELGKVLEKASEESLGDISRLELVRAVEDSVWERKVARPKSTNILSVLLGRGRLSHEATIRLIGLWKVEEYREQLEKISISSGAGEKMEACLEAIVLLGGPKSRAFIDSLTEPKVEARLRYSAILALADLDVTAAATKAVAYLEPLDSPADLHGMFTAFLNRKGGPSALVKALEGKKLKPELARYGIRAVRLSVQDVPELVAALQKAGDLAAQKRELTKGELDALVNDVRALGSFARGEALYRRNDMQCLKCHAIGGAGGQVGPDLVSIGASAPIDYLIESLLIPNKAVKEGFHSLRVETLDGKVHIGVKVRESKTEIVLRNADDKEIVIPANDVDTKRESRSLMPDGLVDTLTRGELLDLTHFLSELGKVGPGELSKSRTVRRWQVLQNTKPAGDLIRRSRIAAVAENDSAFVWNSAYAKVSGELPLEGLPTLTIWKDTAPLLVVRAQLDVTAPGKVKVKLNSAEGISMLVGANPVETKDETIIDLPAGSQVLIFSIDTTKRKEPVRCELEDVEGSSARVSVVGGK